MHGNEESRSRVFQWLIENKELFPTDGRRSKWVFEMRENEDSAYSRSKGQKEIDELETLEKGMIAHSI